MAIKAHFQVIGSRLLHDLSSKSFFYQIVEPLVILPNFYALEPATAFRRCGNATAMMIVATVMTNLAVVSLFIFFSTDWYVYERPCRRIRDTQ